MQNKPNVVVADLINSMSLKDSNQREEELQLLLDIRKELIAKFAKDLEVVESIEKGIKSLEWEPGKYGAANEMTITHAAKNEVNEARLTQALVAANLNPDDFKITIFDVANKQLKGFLTAEVKDKVGFTQKVSLK